MPNSCPSSMSATASRNANHRLNALPDAASFSAASPQLGWNAKEGPELLPRNAENDEP
jgi:hypothetical protein